MLEFRVTPQIPRKTSEAQAQLRFIEERVCCSKRKVGVSAWNTVPSPALATPANGLARR
jgi:hypothetical protein